MTAEDKVILEIIRAHSISDHHEMLQHLAARGIQMPQSTLSRRFKKLGLSKVRGYYKALPEESLPYPRILRLQKSLPNLLVLHTLPGHAGSLAFYLDQRISASIGPEERVRESFEGLLGTIAGDDTVLLILRDQLSLEQLHHKISELWGELS